MAQVKILFDNYSIDDRYSIGWGFSCLVDKRILLDTGEKADLLAHNFDQMNIDVKHLEAVILSHDHWDHTGGLEEILKRKPGLPVYTCPRFAEELKKKIRLDGGCLKECDGFHEIDKCIHTTGEIIGTYHDRDIAEQALVIDAKEGVSVITGCAHPGIVKILEIVQNKFPNRPFYSVIGGFHLMHESIPKIDDIVKTFKNFGIRKVGPAHCSGEAAKQIFRDSYGDNFLLIKAGKEVRI